mmetsp:Transcript_4321/g.27518  ORF Transcript_4321/g.27518 Transcript_4321/m.27518 type:complete len:85 (+) Transcript_4321:208-462(+)
MTRLPLQWSKRCLHNADTKVGAAHTNEEKEVKSVTFGRGNVVHRATTRKKGNVPSTRNSNAKVAEKDKASSERTNWAVVAAKHG